MTAPPPDRSPQEQPLSRHRPAPQPWQVALALPLPPHDFLPPHGAEVQAPLGARVLVPWRGELTVGVVVGVSSGQSSHRLREAVHVLDARPHIHPAFLAALHSAAALSRTPLGLLLSDLLGVGWDARQQHEVRAVPGADLGLFGDAVPGDAWGSAAEYVPGVLDAIREQGLLDERFTPQQRTVTGYRALAQEAVAPDAAPLTARQAEAWRTLAQVGPLPSQAEWAARAGVSGSVVAQVLARGWAQMLPLPAPEPLLPPPGTWLPRVAADTLPESAVWRLHGGRSRERYARLAARVRRMLTLGRGVLIIAPDHATLRGAWDDLSGLAAACGTRAVCFSGALNQGQREHAWGLVQRGEAGLIVGSALALAAPHPDLGLIVLLEEASDAHKLLGGSRAFVPELAARMAAAGDLPLALMGCVPAAESLLHPGEVLPPPKLRLHVVDYTAPPEQPELGPLSSPHLRPGDLGYPLSHDLSRVLRQVQERGRQAVLLAPRRGYSALLRCSSCQHTPGCPNCDVALRFHQERRSLHCHQCGFELSLPDRCEQCGDPMWQARGPGTEWIAQEVRKLLPGLPVYRHDADHQDDLSAVQRGEPGVVVGTQGLLSQDAPPNLALIGVTLADTWLNVSDFRAGERYHRLLRQLSAWHPTRAPLTVVQTFQPQHPALSCFKAGQDAGFYPALEVRAREGLGYPPHRLLTHIEVAARERERAARAAQEVADALHGAGAVPDEVLGPAPAPLARVRGLYPYQLLLRTRSETRLKELLASLDRRFPARVRVDVSPRGMG